MLTAVVALWALSAWAQGISYQAVLRDANGQIMANQEVKLRLSILNGATPVYQEEQTVTTTPQGIINIAIGEGNATDGTFADIDWSQAYDLLVEVDANESGTYAAMPTTPLRPVPQAYHAKWAENLKTSGSKGVTLEAQSTIDDDSLLFGVRNNKGDLVFAVYNNAVAVYVDTTPNGRPTQRAGFAVGGMAGRDGKQGKPLLQVDLSGTTVHVDDGAEATNGGRPVQKASFAVGGMAGRDSEQWQTLFNVDATGTKVHVDPPSEGGRPVQKASFAVGGMAGRATVAPLFRVDSVGTTVLVDDTSKAQGRPVQKASFAVGGMAGRAGDAANYFVVTKDSTRVYVDDRDARPEQKASFAVGGMAGRAGGGRYMDITKENYIIGHGAGKKLMSGTAPGKNNSIMGTNAGEAVTTGSDNVFLGYYAGKANTTGASNVFVGNQAGVANTKGRNNVFMGTNAGKGMTSGYNNIYMGNDAGRSDTAGFDNVFIGYQAGYSLCGNTGNSGSGRGGWGNIFIGESAACNTVNSQNSVFIGSGYRQTGFKNELSYSVAMGNLCFHQIKIPESVSILSCVAIGNYACYGFGGDANECTGIDRCVYNVFLGYSSGDGFKPTTLYGGRKALDENTAVGGQSAQNAAGYGTCYFGSMAGMMSDGDRNVFMGQYCGVKYKGDLNTFVGTNIGYESDGDDNVYLGNYVGKYSSGSKNVYIGNSVGAGNSANNKNIESNVVRIGGSYKDNYIYATGSIMELKGTVTSNANNTYDLGSSTKRWKTIYAQNTLNTSDKRLKTDIRPLENALAKVLKLNGVSYKWRAAEFPKMNFDSKQHVGVIAQEVEAVLPEAVETGEDGYKSVSYGNLTPLLIEAIKEQQQTIDKQQQRIEKLEQLVEQLMKK